MNWTKVVVAGVAAGIVLWLTDFVMHGLMLGPTYARYTEVFSQPESGDPIWFLVLSVLIAATGAALFARTRSSWGAGAAGGAAFGFWMGVFGFFGNFYWALIIDGFPYFLSWCWGGAGFISLIIMGAVIGLVYKDG